MGYTPAKEDNAPAGYGFIGYIDDLRITKGIARYTTTFTPPTAAFPTLGGPTITASYLVVAGGGSGSGTAYGGPAGARKRARHII
jgi:hypothetical protein